METSDLLKRRFFQLLLIAAWLALGTVMIVLRPHWWVWFAAVSYVIAVIYIVAEILTWRHAMRQKGKPAEQKDQGQQASGEEGGHSS